MQKLSSMNTSVNTSKLPAVWNKLNWDWVRNHSISNIVDYGCGKRATQNLVRNKLLDEIAVRHCYFPYDPYWGDVDAIRNAISCLTQWKEADLCVCASVLNVIDSVDAIKKIIKEVTQAAYWVFSIYEGNKSGEGKETKEGCWQHNKRNKEYCWIFNELEVGPYYVKGNIITNNLSLLK